MLITASFLKKIPQTSAVDILARYTQEPEFLRQINPARSPIDLINEWYDDGDWSNVVVFLCHSLFAKEAIWWGYLCALSREDQLCAEHRQALNTVHRWLQDSSEPNRRMADIEVQKIGLDNAAGWLCQAVFWSGGSITPLNAPESPAPPYLYSHAVAGSICLSALLPDAQAGETRYKQFIATGIDIAAGGSGR